ncbi:hypothetical protein HYS54_01985 [Candidatus Micrarchaeota archaeon]|nr:hypothetical protein [Candidatus Micrarchaeota archaeon]
MARKSDKEIEAELSRELELKFALLRARATIRQLDESILPLRAKLERRRKYDTSGRFFDLQLRLLGQALRKKDEADARALIFAMGEGLKNIERARMPRPRDKKVLVNAVDLAPTLKGQWEQMVGRPVPRVGITSTYMRYLLGRAGQMAGKR